MKEIPLTRGYAALVDDEDFDRVVAHKWHALVNTRADGSVRVYGQRSVRNPGGDRTAQMLHRFIMSAPDGVQVDHINGNPLDNRRANMRDCTNAENRRNMRPRTGGTSAYKGVCWHKGHAKWAAELMANRKKKFLGYFTSEQEASHAYDIAAQKYHGQFARLNRVEVAT
jgi:hypothetical protein